jgi:hypothetical protein
MARQACLCLKRKRHEKPSLGHGTMRSWQDLFKKMGFGKLKKGREQTHRMCMILQKVVLSQETLRTLAIASAREQRKPVSVLKRKGE